MVLVVSFISFILLHLSPGDPVLNMLGYSVSPEVYAQTRAILGLDQPLHIQYFDFISKFIRFDFGRSIFSGKLVSDMILERLPATLTLGISGMLLTVVIGIPLGIYTAIRENSKIDIVSRIASLTAISMPGYWVGLLLVFIFSLTLGLFPVQGRGIPPDIQHLILPTVALSLGSIAITSRLTRSCMLEELGKDYVRTARAKGLSERTVLYKHVLKNAIPTVLFNLGQQAALTVVGGSLIIEVIFAWPGIGRLMFQSMMSKDFPVIQVILVMMSIIGVTFNIFFDLLAAFIDPRIRKGMM